jgi:hypothetical protein
VDISQAFNGALLLEKDFERDELVLVIWYLREQRVDFDSVECIGSGEETEKLGRIEKGYVC